MRPTILEALSRAGWSRLAWLVPTPEMVYVILFGVVGVAFVRRASRMGLSREKALEAVLVGGILAGVGSRVFFLVTTGALGGSSPGAWLSTGAGTASWGAYLGGVVGLILYGRLSRLGALTFLDLGTSLGGLYELIGRWSCFLAGDDFGRVSDHPWAIRFPSGSLAHRAHVAAGHLDPTASASLPVHPLQFYLMANGLLVFLVVSWVWRRWRGEPGVTSAAFLLVHGATRFWWELLRDPAAGGAFGLLSTSQWSCLAFVAAGGALLVTRRHRLVAGQPRPQCA